MMDIKYLHEMIEKLVCCAKAEIDKQGIENVDTEEMGKAADIIKDLSEAMYYRTLTEAMSEAEYGEDYDFEGPYNEDRRGYRGQPRDSMGRYRSRRGRRGYEDRMPMDYEREEYMRDMDRYMGRMYYAGEGGGGSSGGMSSSRGQSSGGMGGESSGGTSGGMSSSGSGGGSGGSRGYSERGGSSNYRDEREGRSGRSRRSYMETKETNKGDSTEEKHKKLKELETYMSELSSDITEMISDASAEEKSMLKSKLQTLTSKI